MTTITTRHRRPQPRQPLIPISSIHPSLLHSSTAEPTSSISLSSSQKRPSTALASSSHPGQNHAASQGRRKTSRTEKGAVVTADEDVDGVADEAGVAAVAREEGLRTGGAGGVGQGLQAGAQEQQGEGVNAGSGASSVESMASASGSASTSPSRAIARTISPTVIITPRVRDILHRDDLGTGKSPARRLFVDMPGAKSAAASGEQVEGAVLHVESGTSILPGSSSRTHSPTHVLAPSPPLIPTSLASTSTPTSTTSPPPTHTIPTAPTTPTANLSSTHTAFLLPGLAEIDENGVQRSVHDPGFSVLMDILSRGVSGAGGAGVEGRGVTACADDGAAKAASASAPATPSRAGTPAVQASAKGPVDTDKENIPPPRDPAFSCMNLPKTPSSAPGSASSTRTAMPIADWSKGGPVPSPGIYARQSSLSTASASGSTSYTPPSASASATSEAEVEAFLSLGLTPSRHHLNLGTYSPTSTGSRWTPGHVRVKSKLAEEIGRSPSGKGTGARRGKGGNNEGNAEREREILEGVVGVGAGAGPMTRSRARGIRS